MPNFDKKLLLIPIFIIVFIVLPLGYFFYIQDNDQVPDSNIIPTPTIDLSNANYYDATARINIDNEDVLLGEVVSVSEENITISNQKGERTLAFVDEEVILACTNQSLDLVQILDYDQMESVHAVSTSELGSYLDSAGKIVVFREKTGEKRLHSVAVGVSVCENNNLR